MVQDVATALESLVKSSTVKSTIITEAKLIQVPLVITTASISCGQLIKADTHKKQIFRETYTELPVFVQRFLNIFVVLRLRSSGLTGFILRGLTIIILPRFILLSLIISLLPKVIFKKCSLTVQSHFFVTLFFYNGNRRTDLMPRLTSITPLCRHVRSAVRHYIQGGDRND